MERKKEDRKFRKLYQKVHQKSTPAVKMQLCSKMCAFLNGMLTKE